MIDIFIHYHGARNEKNNDIVAGTLGIINSVILGDIFYMHLYFAMKGSRP